MTSITMEPGPLARAMKDVTYAVNRQETLPILSHVLIEAVSDTHIRISATDMEKRIERTVAADVDGPCSFTVEAARFASVVSAFDGQVRMVPSENGIAVTSGRSRFRFATLKADQFPPALPFEAATQFTAGSELVQALNVSRHAHGTMETLAWSLGALLTDREGMEVVALDGQRMAFINLGGKGVGPAIIPTAVVDLIMKLADGEFQVELSDRAIRCDFGMTVVTAKLIDGNYADYTRFTKLGEMPHRVLIHSDDLRAALGRMALMADDRDRKVRLAFEPEKLTLTLDTHLDQAVEEMPCNLRGEPLTVAFRSQYLRDALAALDADDVKIDMSGPRDPVRITSDQRKGVTLIVMPLLA